MLVGYFKQNKHRNKADTSFGEGIWEKVAEGKEVSTIKIDCRNSHGLREGTGVGGASEGSNSGKSGKGRECRQE